MSLSSENETEISTRTYWRVYCLVFIFDGLLVALCGSIYVELQHQLSTTTVTVSLMYSALSMGYIVSNIACGFLADRITEVHRLLSFWMALTSLVVIALPLTTSVPLAFVWLTLIGVGWAVIETLFTLLVFRLYPTTSGARFCWGSILIMASSFVTSFLMQFSIQFTGSYLYPCVFFGIVGLTHAVLVLFLKTPVHDPLRALKRQMSVSRVDTRSTISTVSSPSAVRSPISPMSPMSVMTPPPEGASDTENDTDFEDAADPETLTPETTEADLNALARRASQRLADSRIYTKLQNATLTLLIISMGFHGATERGLLSFITTYSVDYLYVDDKFGRFLMMAYFGGVVVYRAGKQVLFPDASLMWQCVGCFALRFVLGVAFMVFGHELQVLFVLYGAMGLMSGLAVPGLCGWGELVKPTTGLSACLWWVSYGVGDVVMTMSMGALMQVHGARVMPFVVAVPMLMGAVCAAVAAVLYVRMQREEQRVFEHVGVPTKDGEEVNGEGERAGAVDGCVAITVPME